MCNKSKSGRKKFNQKRRKKYKQLNKTQNLCIKVLKFFFQVLFLNLLVIQSSTESLGPFPLKKKLLFNFLSSIIYIINGI